MDNRCRKRCRWCVTLSAQAWLIVAATAPAVAGDARRGEPMYQRYCTGCHGTDGRGGGKNFMPHVGALTRKGYTDLLEDSYTTAAKGASDYGLKLLEITRANTNAAFDFASELMTVKSFSEVVELSTAHARKQFDAMSAQTKELTALAQKVATESTEPLKAGVTNAFKKVA